MSWTDILKQFGFIVDQKVKIPTEDGSTIEVELGDLGRERSPSKDEVPDWAKTLGLGRNWNMVTLEQLRTRYLELAKMHHPDRGGSSARMQEINVAYAEARAAKGCKA